MKGGLRLKPGILWRKSCPDLTQPGRSLSQSDLGLPDRVRDLFFHVAELRLHLASGLVELAFGLQLLVSDNLADGFLDAAFDLFCASLDLIFVHGDSFRGLR